IRVREEQVKAAKEKLKAWCSANGDIQISSDFAFGFQPNETTNWPVSDVKEVFEKHGHKIDGHVSFSKTSLRKLVAQARRLDPDFAEDLERVARPTVETRFKGHRI
ncbi:MAG: hypothetical protein ACYTBJ_17930, partial [Planctomycetota bacterium]